MDLQMSWFHTVVNTVAGSNVLPRPARALLYRLMGIDVRTLNVFSGCRITSRRVSIGAGTFVNHECYLDAGTGMIEVGEDCQLGPQVQILAMTHSVLDGAQRRQSIATKTVVEDGVWLGARCILTPGVRVGAGCVVAAGAVVTADCAPAGVYAGVPARKLKDVPG